MRADVYVMSKPNVRFSGVVDNVGFGVAPDADVVGRLTAGLPDVQRTLNWVHLASRFPVRDREAMSFKHKIGNLILSMAMSILYFRWVRDSQSGMWVFRRSILAEMKLEADGMAFSEEIKIEALKHRTARFAEISILYTSRLGEIKLNPWRDGFYNLWFLVKKRFS